MGEARRRKLAGLMPDTSDCFAAVRRFWQGRDPGPVEAFKAPVGTVAITLDVDGVPPSTCLIDATKVVDLVSKINQLTKHLGYYQIVQFAASTFTASRRSGDDATLQWLGFLVLWTALNHPKLGATMRHTVSAALAEKGKAHITWRFAPTTGLAIALADQFVDLEPMAAAAPKNQIISFDFTTPDGETPPQH